MQFNQINYFLRSCDTLNFTQAAKICHVSQPSLSAAIQNLEEELGGLLFERTGRAVKLTPLGESMRVHLKSIEQAKELANIAAEKIVKGETNILNIGFMCTLSPLKLLSAITPFTDEDIAHEILIHDVWESRALDLLLAGSLDCLIMAHSSDLPDRFSAQRLSDEPMLLAMHESHAFASRESVCLSDLHNQKYVDRLRCEFRKTFFEELSSHNFSMNVVLRSEREDLIGHAISEAVGISVMPQSAAENFGLKTCKLDNFAAVRTISIVTVKDRQLHSSVDQFVEYVRSAYG